MQHIIDKLKEEYPKGVELWYVDYNDNLEEDKESITALLEWKFDVFYERVDECFLDNRHEYVYEIIKEVFPDDLTDEEEDAAREWCRENDTFNPIEQLLKNTRDPAVRLMLRTNYEFIDRDYKDSEAFKDAKKALKGKMSMKEFTEWVRSEFTEICSDYGNVCFVWTIDLLDVYKSWWLKKIKVLSWTQRWLHNARAGTCWLIENEVTKEFTIDLEWRGDSQYDRRDLVLDDDDWYGIDQVCWMTREFWERWGFIPVR